MLVPEKLDETIMNLRLNDPICQELLEKSQVLCQEYFRIMEALEPADRAFMQQYYDLCEDLEDRTVQLVAAHYACSGAAAFVNTEP